MKPAACESRPPIARLPAALPADQGADHAEPVCRRVEPGRADPERDRAGQPLQREPGHRAQGGRRARRREPADPPSGQGHLRRVARRGAASQFRFLRMRRTTASTSIRRAGCSISGAARRAPTSRRLLRPASRGERCLILRRVLLVRRRARRATRKCAAGARCSEGSRAARRTSAYHGMLYSMYETEFGVRILHAEERLKAVAADATAAARLGRRAGRAGAADRARRFTYGERAGRAAPQLVRYARAPLPATIAER